jgi:hypothetical protein
MTDSNGIGIVTIQCLSNEAILLFYRSGIGGFEGNCHVGEFCVSLFAALMRNLPEV